MIDTVERNKSVVVRFCQEVCGEGELALVEELVAEEASFGSPLSWERATGRQGIAGVVGELRGAFPDLELAIENVLAEGSTVAVHWLMRGTQQGPLMRFPASGRAAESLQIAFFRVEDGRVADATLEFDLWSLLAQLHLLPPLDSAPAPALWLLGQASKLVRAIRGQRESPVLGRLPSPDAYAMQVSPGSDEDIPERANKELVHRILEEIFNARNVDAADELVSRDVVVQHPIHRGSLAGVDGFKQLPTGMISAYPDLRVTSEALIAERNLVAARWVIKAHHIGHYRGLFPGLPPTGREVVIPVHEIVRVGGGKAVEMLFAINILGVANQLRVVPPWALSLAARAQQVVRR